MHYYCNEDAKNLVELEIKNRKEALELYSKVIEVVEKFDEKVLNKRFDTALKTVDKRLSYEREYNRFEIQMNVFDSRCCKSVKEDNYGYSSYNYLTTNYLVLNNLLYTYSYSEEDIVLLNNERINSSVLIESLLIGEAHMKNEIASLEYSLTKIDEWKKKLESLREEVQQTMKTIPYVIREYYDINYSISNR